MALEIRLFGNSSINAGYFYNSGAGTYTSLSGDLFDDSFEAGDILYFCHTSAAYSFPFTALLFNVSTAIAATSYELIWEYYDYSDGWTEMPDLVDDTNSFSVTGENYVRWRVPYTVYHSTINSLNRLWVRCRVVSADTPTEGGAYTSTIKYKLAGFDMNGGTESTPITIDDIMAVSDLTDWGMIEQTGIRSYKIYGKVQQANDCYFLGTNLILDFASGYPLGGYWQFGEANGSYLPGKNGCSILMTACRNDKNIRWASQKYALYSTTIDRLIGDWVNYSTGVEAYYTIWKNGTMFGGGEMSFTECVFPSLSTYTAPSSYDWTFNGGNYAHLEAYQYSNGFIARDALISTVGLRWSTKFIAYDCTISSLSIWGNALSDEYPANYYRHHSLNLTVQDKDGTPIEGASVTIKDQYGNDGQFWEGDTSGELVDISNPLTTDANGQVSTDILHYLYNRIFYPSVTTTTTTYSPFTVTISATGYQTKVIKYTMDQKRTEVETLEKQVETIIAKGEVAINTDPENSQSDVFV